MSNQNTGFGVAPLVDTASLETANIANDEPQLTSMDLIDPRYWDGIDWSNCDMDELWDLPSLSDETAAILASSPAAIGGLDATPQPIEPTDVHHDDLSAFLTDFDSPVLPKPPASAVLIEEPFSVVEQVSDIGSWNQGEPAGTSSQPTPYSTSDGLNAGQKGTSTELPQSVYPAGEWLLQQPVSLEHRCGTPASEFDISDPRLGEQVIFGGYAPAHFNYGIPWPHAAPFNQACNPSLDYANGYQHNLAPLQVVEQTPGGAENPGESSERITDSDYSENEDIPLLNNASRRKEARRLQGDRNAQPRNRSVPAEPPLLSSNKSLQLTRPNMSYVPNDAYQPLRRAPKSWGRFRYTKNGELEPSDLFTAEEIDYYLFENPLHQQAHSKRKSKLVLRIHRNPPESANRFPTVHGSHRCRFRDCPAQNNTINQGQYAVIFDELSVDNPNHDPFLNAGWVHLYCLERFCNFPKVCKHLNVQSENRTFVHESSKHNKGNNRMRLDKIRGVEKVVEHFIECCRNGTLPESYPRFKTRDEKGAPYENTLCHKMNLKKQRGQPGAVTRQEAAREQAAGRKGGTLSNHLGNLVVECPIRHNTRKHGNQNQLVANPRHRRTYKHEVDKCESEDDAVSEDKREDNEDGVEELRHRERRYAAPTANDQPTGPQQWQQGQVHVAPNASMVPSAPPTQLQPQYFTEDPGLSFLDVMQPPAPQYPTNVQSARETQAYYSEASHPYSSPTVSAYDSIPAPQGMKRTSDEAEFNISIWNRPPDCGPTSNERQLKKRRETPAPYDAPPTQAPVFADPSMAYTDPLMQAATYTTGNTLPPAAPMQAAIPRAGTIGNLAFPVGSLAQRRASKKRSRDQVDSNGDEDGIPSSLKRHRTATPVDNSSYPTASSQGSFVQRLQRQQQYQQQRLQSQFNVMNPRASHVAAAPAGAWEQYEAQHTSYTTMTAPQPLDQSIPIRPQSPPLIPNPASIAGHKRKHEDMDSQSERGPSKRTPDPNDVARSRSPDQHTMTSSWCGM